MNEEGEFELDKENDTNKTRPSDLKQVRIIWGAANEEETGEEDITEEYRQWQESYKILWHSP